MCQKFVMISPVRSRPVANMSAVRNPQKTHQPSPHHHQHHHHHSRNMPSPTFLKNGSPTPRGSRFQHGTPYIHKSPNTSISMNMHHTNNRKFNHNVIDRNDYKRNFNNTNRRTPPEPQPTPNVFSPSKTTEHVPQVDPFNKITGTIPTTELLPKPKVVTVALTCEEVEAQASKGTYKGPLTCDEVELMLGSSIITTTGSQPNRSTMSSPTPSSSSGYESISSSLSVITDDDYQSEVSPPSPKFVSKQVVVQQSSPIPTTSLHHFNVRMYSPVTLKCTHPFSTLDTTSNLNEMLSIIHNLGDETLCTIENNPDDETLNIDNPDDDGYSSCDSVDKFISVSQIESDEGLGSSINSANKTTSKDSSSSATEIWNTFVKAGGLPGKFLSSKDQNNNNKKKKNFIENKKITTTQYNKNKNGKKVSTSPLSFTPAFGVMPDLYSSPPKALNLPLPPDMWKQPADESKPVTVTEPVVETKPAVETKPSTLTKPAEESNRVDVTGLFTSLLSRSNSPVVPITDQTPVNNVISSNCNGPSTLLHMRTQSDSLNTSLAALDIQPRYNVKSPYYHNLSSNDCALEVLKQNQHGIHRFPFNLLDKTANYGAGAA